MKQTDQITELAAALAKAQGEIVAAKRDAENPHFRHRYADLSAIWDACRAALAKYGLSVVQSPRLVVTGETVWFVEVETRLLHESGQSLSDVLAVPLARTDAQGVGSACTYARRYALAAFVGVAPAGDDDDAEAAVEPERKREDLPAGAMESVTVRITGIVKRPLSNGREKFIISADDGTSYQTFSVTIAKQAKEAKLANHAVDLTYKTTPYGRDVVSLQDATAPEPVL